MLALTSVNENIIKHKAQFFIWKTVLLGKIINDQKIKTVVLGGQQGGLTWRDMRGNFLG
jgi:hypothetical protein